MRMRSKAILATTAVTALSLLAATPGLAATVGVTNQDAGPASPVALPETTMVTLPLAHAAALTAAESVAERDAIPAVAYSFDNGDVVGEYSPSDDQTTADFLGGEHPDGGGGAERH